MHLKLFFIFIFIFLILPLQAKDQVAMGYLKTDLNYFKYKDTQIAFRLWIDEIAKEKGVTLKVNYYDDAQRALEDYKTFNIDSYSLNTMYYLKNMKSLDAQTLEFWAMLNDKNIPEKLLILVPSESNITKVADLKDKVVALKNDDLLAKLFLKKELLQTQHTIPSEYIRTYSPIKKNSTALLNTFFKKCDACIVPESTLNMAAELNPALKKKLRVLKASPNIYTPGIMLIHKGTSQEMRLKLRQSIANLDKTPKGRNVKALFKLKNFTTITPKSMQLLREYYKEYLKLQASYNHE